MDKTANYLLYDQDGNGDANQMAVFLKSQGFEHIYTLIGGIDAWIIAGYSVTSTPESSESTT